MLKVDMAIRRFVMFIGYFLMFAHVFSCIWIVAGQIEEDNPNSWMKDDRVVGMDTNNLYVTSFYFIITTITTVGYGDYSPTTFAEKIIGVIIMFVGVIAFSFASGSLSNYIHQQDNHSAAFEEKMVVLDKLH